MDQQTLTSYAIFIVVILLVGFRILRRRSGATGKNGIGQKRKFGERRLRIELMWVRPVILTSLLGLTIAGSPPPLDVVSASILSGCVLVGALLGWTRGRMTRITINVDTHELMSKASPWGMLIFFGLMIGRILIRMALKEEHDVLGIPVVTIIDGVTVLYGASILTMQLEMWLRARKLLADTIAAKEAGKAVAAEVTQEHA